MATGKVTKLKIIAYKDPKYEEEAFGAGNSTYETMINPESLKFSNSIKLITTEASGADSTDVATDKATPSSLSIQFLFDATGVISSLAKDLLKENNSIEKQINKLKSFVYDYSSETHQPYYVKILYGSVIFKGVLETIDFDYKLFASDGEPLRVIATTKFVESVEDNLRAAKQNLNSPDLTHVRQVVEGDTLPAMCHKIYGNSRYYLEVAKSNNLTKFRKLTPGQTIYFPPIEKIS